jgi:hypothetical protein
MLVLGVDLLLFAYCNTGFLFVFIGNEKEVLLVFHPHKEADDFYDDIILETDEILLNCVFGISFPYSSQKK